MVSGYRKSYWNDIFAPRVKTLMFNGYGDEVANLYTGMDLKKYF